MIKLFRNWKRKPVTQTDPNKERLAQWIGITVEELDRNLLLLTPFGLRIINTLHGLNGATQKSCDELAKIVRMTPREIAEINSFFFRNTEKRRALYSALEAAVLGKDR